MKHLLFVLICLSCTSSHAAYQSCLGFSYPNDETSPPCVVDVDNAYYFTPSYWTRGTYSAYCTVTSTDNPLDPSGLSPGPFILAPLDGDNYYSVPTYDFGESYGVPYGVTWNVYVKNLVINPEPFGIFTQSVPDARLLVDCNAKR